MKFLNVGGNNKSIPVHKIFDNWEHHLLDIDPKGNPDICCDARELETQEEGQYDAIYCSHNLEHFYFHDVPKVLKGFSHVTNEKGFVYVAVPNIKGLMKRVVASNLELTDSLYRLSDNAPITAMDMIFGWGKEIDQSGKDYFSHKCGFSANLLANLLKEAGFKHVIAQESELDLLFVAFKREEELKEYNNILTVG